MLIFTLTVSHSQVFDPLVDFQAEIIDLQCDSDMKDKYFLCGHRLSPGYYWMVYYNMYYILFIGYSTMV